MEKVLVTIENSYGKNDGHEVVDSFTIIDSKEAREELVDEYSWSRGDIWDSVDDFINGEQDTLDVELTGGDWDEPTGRFISISTKEEALKAAQKTYETAVASIEHSFK